MEEHSTKWILAMILCILTVTPTLSSHTTDETITDPTGDVCSIDYLTGETTIITNSSYIEINNLDLIQATYRKVGIQANLSLQVNGTIEDRGEFFSPDEEPPPVLIDAVEYAFELTTSEEEYSVAYCNRTGQLLIGGSEQINLTASDFSIKGNSLSIVFNLSTANETYMSLSATTTYIKANLSNITSGFAYYADLAPNPPLTIIEAYGPSIGYVGQTIQFNATIEPLSGTPPYSYHWDFGDGDTSPLLNPTHVYATAGNFTYTFTVIDDAGASANKSGTIAMKTLKKAFIFGRYTNISLSEGFLTVTAGNLRLIHLAPFRYQHYTKGETLIALPQYKAKLFADKFLVGMFTILE